MKIVLALALFLVAVSGLTLKYTEAEDDEWNSFKEEYEKEYDTEEEESLRKAIFFQNKKTIEAHNKKFERGESTFEMGINQFGDMLSIEITNMLNGLKTPARNETAEIETFDDIDILQLPKHVDWRLKHVVTPIKNQGQCGSCWAFSTTGALEAQHALKTKQLVSLSEQNLIDCSFSEGNHGCGGGWPFQAFEYIKLNNGIDTEKSYPYVSAQGQQEKCKFSKNHVGAKDRGYKNIASKNEKALQKAVAKVGPISVCIDASHEDFQRYKRGIYSNTNCSRDDLDHAVLTVGYGVHKGKKYWLVKNSWGTSWGMDGYFWMAKDEQNMCGIATKASYPLV